MPVHPRAELGLPPAPARRRPRAGTSTASRSRCEGSELLARCIQHETDHLDGVLFVDRLDPATRKQAMAEIRAAEWFGRRPPVVKVSPHPMFGQAR